MSYNFQAYATRASWQAEATDIIAVALKSDIDQFGHASLLCSGGSTPGPVYNALSNATLDWSRVQIGLVDERWVDETDAGSNAAGLRRDLLKGAAAQADFIPMKNAALTAYAGQADTERAYQSIAKPYSLAIMGMGSDGHTASWFPQAAELNTVLDPETPDLVRALTANPSAVTGEYLERITLTLSAIMQCQTVLLLITGAEKRAVFETAQEADLPVGALMTACANRLRVLWTP